MTYKVKGRLGQNSNFVDSIAVTPTLDTAAYASGDRLGSIQTLTGACRDENGRAILQSVKILDLNGQSALMNIMLFNALPTIASADNVAINISDAEMDKWIGTVSISASYVATASNSCVTQNPIGLGVKSINVTGTIYAIPVILGAATYSANGLKFIYDFIQT